MLPDARIPFYGDDPWSWPRFLYKASTGSAKAFDVVTHAEMTFMIDVTGSPRAVEEVPLHTLAEIYDRAIGAPKLPAVVLDHALERGWFSHRVEAGDEPRLDEFVGLWGRTAASESRLLRAAAHRAAKRWSGQEIASVGDGNGLRADAAHLVSAMLIMSLTWPEPPTYDAGWDVDDGVR